MVNALRANTLSTIGHHHHIDITLRFLHRQNHYSRAALRMKDAENRQGNYRISDICGT
ncbi:MAG: hypothetical protein NC187_04865 [Candidatus Amulumruptor caecigallinarius]|nr:hypothetical protein [Candidatus Amulumruptor caecigallinarius]MCM1396803.1 hypothetical protein [Candidatus Amulumruptor caecigallinarius]MCM1454253.1 hypothetical protein [bacterium]